MSVFFLFQAPDEAIFKLLIDKNNAPDILSDKASSPDKTILKVMFTKANALIKLDPSQNKDKTDGGHFCLLGMYVFKLTCNCVFVGPNDTNLPDTADFSFLFYFFLFYFFVLAMPSCLKEHRTIKLINLINLKVIIARLPKYYW